MSLSLFSQCWSKTGLTGPCTPPAKKARMGRIEGDGPPTNPFKEPVRRLISGMETSFLGLNLSDVLALHRARIEFCPKCG